MRTHPLRRGASGETARDQVLVHERSGSATLTTGAARRRREVGLADREAEGDLRPAAYEVALHLEAVSWSNPVRQAEAMNRRESEGAIIPIRGADRRTGLLQDTASRWS